MLESKEAIVTLSGSNIKYYESRGYDINSLKRLNNKGKYILPKGSKLLVKIDDLLLKSLAIVNYKCDYCGETYPIEYRVYNVQKDKSLLKKDACQNCHDYKVNESRTLNNQLSNVNNILNIAKEFAEKNLLLISKEFVNCHTKLEYICLKHLDLGVKKIAYTQFKLGQGCKQCGIENRIEKQSLHISNDELVKQFDSRGYDLISKEDLIGSKQKLEYICHKHEDKGIQKISYSKFKLGEGCKYCGFEATANTCRLPYDYVYNEFAKLNYTLLTLEYINNQQKLEYICNKHSDKGSQFIDYSHLQTGVTCYYCSLERRSRENHWNWNGGVSEVTIYLRNYLTDWKKESMKNSNFKCIISGKRFDVIHHLYGFDQILQEVFQETQLPIKQQIKDYTQEELESLSKKCIELHNKYPLGVCLTKKVHELFHLEYLYGSNTSEQFEEFQQRYNNGEFDFLLSAK